MSHITVITSGFVCVMVCSMFGLSQENNPGPCRKNNGVNEMSHHNACLQVLKNGVLHGRIAQADLPRAQEAIRGFEEAITLNKLTQQARHQNEIRVLMGGMK
jgi:hypothetical protein